MFKFSKCPSLHIKILIFENLCFLFKGNQTVSQNDNTYLKTDDDAGSSNQNLQLISTTDVLKQNAQSFDNNVLNNVDDLLYSYPQ